jgi:hypothetical protein
VQQTTTYTPSSATPGTTYYRVLINAANNGCDQAVSNNSIVIISADLAITTQPANISECIGGTDQMTVTISGGSGAITYQWQESANGTNGWVNSTGTGATTATYTPSSASEGTTYYRVLVNAANNNCDQAVSNNGTAVIAPDITISTQPAGDIICIGGNANLTVVASGSPNIHYQWQMFDGSGYVNIGADSPNYNTGALSQTTTYRVYVHAEESGCEDEYSENSTVIVAPDITISAQTCW